MHGVVVLLKWADPNMEAYKEILSSTAFERAHVRGVIHKRIF